MDDGGEVEEVAVSGEDFRLAKMFGHLEDLPIESYQDGNLEQFVGDRPQSLHLSLGHTDHVRLSRLICTRDLRVVHPLDVVELVLEIACDAELNCATPAQCGSRFDKSGCR